MPSTIRHRLLSLLVALSALAAITPGLKAAEPLTIERIYADPLLGGSPPASIRWLPDGKGISYLEKRDGQTHWVVSSVPSGKTRTLCVVDTISVPGDLRKGEKPFAISSYRWAQNGPLAWFVYRGDLFTFNRDSGAVTRLTRSEATETNIDFSPDGRRIAYTRDNDLWVADTETGAETRLTETGSESLLNGVLDWVYMEELFTRGNVKAHWWAHDGSAIVYLQIDESPVQSFPIVDFIPTYNTSEEQHYPKAGSPNPIVRVGIYRFDNGETVWTDIDTTDDSYVARVYWLGDSKSVAIEKLNRGQDRLSLHFADAVSGKSRVVLREEKDTWININYMKHYYRTKNRFVWSSERNGFAHLYLYENDQMVAAITAGPWDVTELHAVNEKRGHVYFTALKDDIKDRQLYRVSDTGKGLRRVSQRAGTHSVEFSPDHKYYVDRFSNSETPTTITVHDASGKMKFSIHEPDADLLSAYDLPKPEFFNITSGDGLEFYCSMIKPSDFDPSRRYPVIVYTYGGPHAQVVRNRWGGSRYLWHAHMASRGYIVFSLDNRGSFGRGSAWENHVLEDMGNYELQDQRTGVAYLKTLPYVDASRIGIWGWSYGGYMTCMALFKAPGVFAAGAAVAPVTDWRFYDTIYTERYMRHPDDNAEGYEKSSPIEHVEGLSDPFLLIHGTADDNVHMSNSMRLVHELINAGKDFDLMLYPRKLHGISGDKARVHLYKRLSRFFDRHLTKNDEPQKQSS